MEYKIITTLEYANISPCPRVLIKGSWYKLHIWSGSSPQSTLLSETQDPM